MALTTVLDRPPMRVLYVATVLDAHDWPGFFETKLSHLLGKPLNAQPWPLPTSSQERSEGEGERGPVSDSQTHSGESTDVTEGSTSPSSPSPNPPPNGRTLPSHPGPFPVDLRFLGFGYHREQFGAWEYQYQGVVGADAPEREVGTGAVHSNEGIELKKVSDNGAWSWEVLEDWLQRNYVDQEEKDSTSVQVHSSSTADTDQQRLGQGCHLVMGMHGHGDSFWFKHHVGRQEGTEVLVEEMVHRLRTGLDLPVDPACTHKHNHHLYHHFPLIGSASPQPQSGLGLPQRRRFLSVTLDACIMSELHTAALFNRITPYLLACQGWMWEEDWDVDRSVFNRYTLGVLAGAGNSSFQSRDAAKVAFKTIAEVFSGQSPRGDLAVLDTGNAVALVMAMQQNPFIQGKLVEEYEREKISMPLKSASTSRSASPKPPAQSGECSLAQSPEAINAIPSQQPEQNSAGIINQSARESDQKEEEQEEEEEDEDEEEALAALALTWDPSPFCFYFIRSEPEDAVVSQYLLCFKMFVAHLLKESETALKAQMSSRGGVGGTPLAGADNLEERVESLHGISRLVRQTIIHHSPPTAAPDETNYRVPLDGLSIHLRLSVKEYKHHLRLQCHHA